MSSRKNPKSVKPASPGDARGQWLTFDPKDRNFAEYRLSEPAEKNEELKLDEGKLDLSEKPDVKLVSVLFQMLAQEHSLRVQTVRSLQKKLAEAVHNGTVIFDHPIHRTDDAEKPVLAYLSYQKFNEWLALIGRPERITVPEPLQRQTHGSNKLEQEKVVLTLIRKLGEDPKRLPVFKPPKSTIKKVVRDTIMKTKSNQLFMSEGVVNETWARLRQKGLIQNVDENNHTSKKKLTSKT